MNHGIATPSVIRIHREPLSSARSLLQHPELAAQLNDASLEAALKVILRYDELANEQQRLFPGPVLSLNFADVIGENFSLDIIDQFIASLIASASIPALTSA